MSTLRPIPESETETVDKRPFTMQQVKTAAIVQAHAVLASNELETPQPPNPVRLLAHRVVNGHAPTHTVIHENVNAIAEDAETSLEMATIGEIIRSIWSAIAEALATEPPTDGRHRA